MELEGETEAEPEPFADLAARLDERGADLEAGWDAFVERAEREEERSAPAEPEERRGPAEDAEEAVPVAEGTTASAEGATTATAETGAAAPEPGDGAVTDPEGADDGVAPSPPTIDAEPVEPEAAAALDELIDEEDDRLAGDAVRRVAEERTYVVPKAEFCETCEHFTAPPEMACGNEGTELVEFEDMEHVRVRDCPVVEERRSFEDIH